MFNRTYALRKHRLILLPPTIQLPSLDEVPSDRLIAIGFIKLIKLFMIVDDTFMNLWNRVCTYVDPDWFAQVQTQLWEATPANLECTGAQAAKISITRQWLRIVTWQLCVSQGFVGRYPIEISRDLLSMTDQISRQDMEVHGAELVRHLIPLISSRTLAIALRSAFRHVSTWLHYASTCC
jgi:hypothetical protein